MIYATYDDYKQIYGISRSSKNDYSTISLQAARIMDQYTTGIDGYRKLVEAFPTDEYDAEAVKVCACKVADLLWQIKQAEDAAIKTRSITETANGMRSGAITAVSAGNESISYSASVAGGGTSTDKAIADTAARKVLFNETIREYLGGIRDVNGVNLLYMGEYPCTEIQ